MTIAVNGKGALSTNINGLGRQAANGYGVDAGGINGFGFDRDLVLYLPLHALPTSPMSSSDRYQHLATVTGATWGSQGRTFDGTDDKIVVPDNDALDFGTGDFTVSIWNRTQDNANTKNLVSKNKSHTTDDATNIGWWFYIESTGSLRFYVKDAANNVVLKNAGGNYEDNVWRLLTARKAAGYISILVNGVQQGVTVDATAVGTLTNTFDMGIGQSVVEGIRVMLGDIGEVLIYNRAFTAGEILYIYNATKGRYV